MGIDVVEQGGGNRDSCDDWAGFYLCRVLNYKGFRERHGMCEVGGIRLGGVCSMLCFLFAM